MSELSKGPYLTPDEITDRIEELRAELENLESVVSVAESCAGWQGGPLIRDDQFENYCRELASEVGQIDASSPLESFVRWDDWAETVRQDYLVVDIDGEDFLIRK